MTDWPELNEHGNLPPGIYQASLSDVLAHFGEQTPMGASIFWIRRLAALGGETATVAHWQVKRDGTERGIVEVIVND